MSVIELRTSWDSQVLMCYKIEEYIIVGMSE